MSKYYRNTAGVAAEFVAPRSVWVNGRSWNVCKRPAITSCPV